MGLNDFSITKERALPIFILADISGSMEGEKIQALNRAIQEMIVTLRNVDEVRGLFKVSIITFGGNKVVVQQPLTNVNAIEFEEMKAGGMTPMGEAISTVSDMIEDRSIYREKDCYPTVVLISDGYPTDYPERGQATMEKYLEWEPIRKLHEGKRSQKCMRIAVSVDAATDLNMLSAFLDNGNKPIPANDAADIVKVFNWITMSSICRMASSNPNDIQSFLKWEDWNDDEIIL